MNENQRLRIISAARTLVAEDGIEALTVRKVAKEARIGPSTLRYYFPTQEALHSEVVRREFDQALSDLDIRKSSRPAHERLVECLLQFLPANEQDLNMITQLPAEHTTVSSHQGPSIANQLLDLATQQARVRIRHWLDLLHKEGALDSRPLNNKVSLLCALVNGLSIDLASMAPSLSLDEAARILEDAVLKLVLNSPSTTIDEGAVVTNSSLG